jgi:hypothetical protein
MPAIFLALTLALQTAAPTCHEWHQCRELALQAAAAHEYETFHDLAWRAVQTGPKNDPNLMYMLARAQVLCGRPHDALVMLQRLAEAGVATDAATNDDFRRTRGLPGWPAVAEMIERAAAASEEESKPAETLSKPEAKPEPAPEPEPEPEPEPADAPPSAEAVPAPAPFEEALTVTHAAFEPAGLAYDAVSKRFVVGDAGARKLLIFDERSHHVVTLVSAASAGFYGVSAIAIDPRRGDLWAVSSGEGGAAIHKLQLVSGRPLFLASLPTSFGNASLVDLAVTRDGTVYALDAAGARVFVVRPGTRKVELAMDVALDGVRSLAPSGDRFIYVAHDGGIARADLGAKKATPLSAAKGIDLTGFSQVRWHRNSLVGVRGSAVVRLVVDRAGTKVTKLQMLDPDAGSAAASAFTVDGDVLYYLAMEEGHATVRRLNLER